MKSNIGELIAQLRKENGIQQKELAKEIGISPARLSNFERGKNKVDVELLEPIANALHVPVGRLLGVRKFDGVLSVDEISIIESMRNNEKTRNVIYQIVDLQGEE